VMGVGVGLLGRSLRDLLGVLDDLAAGCSVVSRARRHELLCGRSAIAIGFASEAAPSWTAPGPWGLDRAAVSALPAHNPGRKARGRTDYI